MTAVNVSSATQATRSVHLLTHPSVHVVQPSTADSRHTEGIYDNDNKNNEQLIIIVIIIKSLFTLQNGSVDTSVTAGINPCAEHLSAHLSEH